MKSECTFNFCDDDVLVQVERKKKERDRVKKEKEDTHISREYVIP